MKNKSFTLIELLVVIAIIGLLASVILVNTGGIRSKARTVKTLEFSQSVQHALGSEAVGIWDFDEGSGDTAKDRSGFNNNGTINVGASFVADTPQKTAGGGAGKNALSFNGTSGFVSAGNGPSTNFTTEDFTIELWIKTTATGGQTLVQRGISQQRGYTLMADPWVHLLTHQPGTYTYVRSKSTVNTGQWQHWAVVKVGATAKLYLNGVEDTPYTVLSNPINNPVSSPNDSLVIGSGSWGYASGLLDEVRVYGKALSLSEIQKHYAEGLESHQNLAKK